MVLLSTLYLQIFALSHLTTNINNNITLQKSFDNCWLISFIVCLLLLTVSLFFLISQAFPVLWLYFIAMKPQGFFQTRDFFKTRDFFQTRNFFKTRDMRHEPATFSNPGHATWNPRPATRETIRETHASDTSDTYLLLN